MKDLSRELKEVILKIKNLRKGHNQIMPAAPSFASYSSKRTMEDSPLQGELPKFGLSIDETKILFEAFRQIAAAAGVSIDSVERLFTEIRNEKSPEIGKKSGLQKAVFD